MSRNRAKTWDTWVMHIEMQVLKTLKRMFGELDKETKMIPILFTDELNSLKEEYQGKELSRKELIEEIIPTHYDSNFDFIANDVLNILMDRVFKVSPDRHAMTRTSIRHGLRIDDIFLDFFYSYCEIEMDIDRLAEDAGIILID